MYAVILYRDHYNDPSRPKWTRPIGLALAEADEIAEAGIVLEWVPYLEVMLSPLPEKSKRQDVPVVPKKRGRKRKEPSDPKIAGTPVQKRAKKTQ